MSKVIKKKPAVDYKQMFRSASKDMDRLGVFTNGLKSDIFRKEREIAELKKELDFSNKCVANFDRLQKEVEDMHELIDSLPSVCHAGFTSNYADHNRASITVRLTAWIASRAFQ